MPDSTPLNLSDEQSHRVREFMASGRYAGPGDVLDAALGLLARREAGRKQLEQKIQEGWDAIERGETVDLDDAFDQLDQLIEESGRRAAG